MLVSLDDMKTYLGISLVDTTYDDFLTEQITIISDTIEAYCRRKFLSNSYIQTFYKHELIQLGKRVYTLKTFHFPLTAIANIEVDGDALGITDYRYNDTGIIVRTDNVDWLSSFSETIEIEYTAGYASTPSPVKSVVYTLVAERYNKQKSGIDLGFGSDVQRVSIPGVMSIDFDYTLQSNEKKSAFGMILGNWANVLDYYRSERAIIGTVENNYVV